MCVCVCVCVTVSGDVVARELVEVDALKALVVAVDGPHQTWPGLLEDLETRSPGSPGDPVQGHRGTRSRVPGGPPLLHTHILTLA